MNVDDSARLFADEGEYERRTRNREVMSEEGRRAVKPETVHKRIAIVLTAVFGEQRMFHMGGGGPCLEHLHQKSFGSYVP